MHDGLKRVVFVILKVALLILLVFLFFKVGKYIVPFIVAYFFASLIEPLVKLLEKRVRIPRKIGTAFSILVVLGSITSVCYFLISRLIREITSVYLSLQINTDSVTKFFNSIMDKVNGIYIQLPPEVTDVINNAVKNLTSNLQNLLKPIVDLAQVPFQVAFSLPQVLIFILVTILATYFMSSDKHLIMRFLDGQIPSDWLKSTRNIANNIFVALFGWLKAQLILMSITFSELLVGLLIIGVENALLIALIIALVDVLPILGAGSVLVPWAVISLIGGHTKLGLSILLLDIIILLVRQLIEPKIVGQQIGVHPLFTLFGMYIGLQVLGVLGMFVGPLSVVVLKYIVEGLLKAETFKNWFERNFRSRGRVVLATDAATPDNKKADNKQPPA
ncbi:MAG: sporulation integral membrane protein YtvI [Clostridia bacterium]|nr:sporulation integral membrane protein YtvI [Clostridia bacterium]